MAPLYRISSLLQVSVSQMAGCLRPTARICCILIAVAANSGTVNAAIPRGQLDEMVLRTQNGIIGGSELLATQPDWLAIDNDQTGVAIELGAKWHEAPHSAAHEREVLTSPIWAFSRIYDCRGKACVTAIRVILSGGVFEAKIDVTSMTDLKDQISRHEVAQLGAMIVGAISIDPDILTPISQAGAFGYRLRVNLQDANGAPIALVVDCLYRGDRFLVLTAITDVDAQGKAEMALDEIASGIVIGEPDVQRDAQVKAVKPLPKR